MLVELASAFQRDVQASALADEDAVFVEATVAASLFGQDAESPNDCLGDDIRIAELGRIDAAASAFIAILNGEARPVTGEVCAPAGSAFPLAAAGVRGVPASIEDVAGIRVENEEPFRGAVCSIPDINSGNEDFSIRKPADHEGCAIAIADIIFNHVVAAQILFEAILRRSLLQIRGILAVKVNVMADAAVFEEAIPHLPFNSLVACKNIRPIDSNVDIFIRSGSVAAPHFHGEPVCGAPVGWAEADSLTMTLLAEDAIRPTDTEDVAVEASTRGCILEANGSGVDAASSFDSSDAHVDARVLLCTESQPEPERSVIRS